MKRILGVACVALALAACSAGVSSCTTNSTSPPILTQTADEKALYVAELAYAAALESTERAVDAGVLKGENAAKASAALEQAHTALRLGREAYVAGDAIQALIKAQEATDAIAGLHGIVPPS